jgi:hypothetical protein
MPDIEPSPISSLMLQPSLADQNCAAITPPATGWSASNWGAVGVTYEEWISQGVTVAENAVKQKIM